MEKLGENLSNVVGTVERTAEKSVKTAVKTTSSLLQNKTVLMVVGAALVLLLVAYLMGWFEGNSTESFANYKSLEDNKNLLFEIDYSEFKNNVLIGLSRKGFLKKILKTIKVMLPVF